MNDEPECLQPTSGKNFKLALTTSNHVHRRHYASFCVLNVLLFFLHSCASAWPLGLDIPDLTIPLLSLIVVMTICLGLILKKEREKEKLNVVQHQYLILDNKDTDHITLCYWSTDCRESTFNWHLFFEYSLLSLHFDTIVDD